MARAKAAAPELPADTPLDADALSTVQNLGAIAQGMQDERDLVNQLLGQAQMADAFAKFSVTVTTSKLAFVKENKLYRALKGQKSRDGHDFLSGTWQEFCGTLGRSVEQVDEDIRNLRQFGEEALESMSRMGIGYRDLRQWRRLPDDAKSALIEAAKTDNKDAVIFLAEELIATHTKEKTELEQKLASVQGDYDAQGEVLTKKNAELDRTKQDLEKARKRIQTLSADEAVKELRLEVTSIAFEAEADISGKLREAFNAMASHSEETGTDHRMWQAGLIRHLEGLLAGIRADFQLPDADESGEDFGWLQHAQQDD